MERCYSTTPSQKVKMLREASNYKLQEFADAIKCSKSKISKIEAGEWEYSEDDIEMVKKLFGIEGAPFTEKEVRVFRERLYGWKNLIRNGAIDEARRNQKKLEVIAKVPFEPELSMLYRLFEIKLLLKESKDELVEKMLLTIETDIECSTNENRHHFYYLMGSIYYRRSDFKSALSFYLKSAELEVYTFQKDIGLHFNIATCYGKLGKYSLAISTIEKVYYEFDYNKTGAARAYIDSILGANYLKIGQATRAKQILEPAISEAIGANHKLFTFFAIHNYGSAFLEAKEYKEAIEEFDRAFEYCDEGDRYYLENTYCKIRCLIGEKKYSKARTLIVEAMTLAEGNEFYLIAFESLSHLMTIKKDESIEFIEKKTIPYFIEKYDYYRVMEYCELLEGIFKKRDKGYKIRALEMSAIISNITREIVFGEEVRL